MAKLKLKIKFKKEYLFLFLFVIIISATGFVLIRYVILTGQGSSLSDVPAIKPAYLLQPIPKIDKLKTILDNPKFREMVYIESFFAPVIVSGEELGRPNPFMPFIIKGQEKE